MFHYALNRQKEKLAEGKNGAQQGQYGKKGLMGRKTTSREHLAKTRQTNTRYTLICIFFTGLFIIAVGVSFTCFGFIYKKTFPNPFNIIGITSTVIGVCVWLMSIEIIVKSRREAKDDSDEGPSKKKPQWSNRIPSAKVHPLPDMASEGVPPDTRDSISQSSEHSSSHGRNYGPSKEKDRGQELTLLPNVLEQDGY